MSFWLYQSIQALLQKGKIHTYVIFKALKVKSYVHSEYFSFFQCVAQDINTDVEVSMGSIETHIDTLEWTNYEKYYIIDKYIGTYKHLCL